MRPETDGRKSKICRRGRTTGASGGEASKGKEKLNRETALGGTEGAMLRSKGAE